MFADVTAGKVGPTLVEAFGTIKPDLVVYEGMDTGAGVAASVHGIPAAAFAIGLARFIYGILHRATVGHHAAEWTGRGQTPPETDLLAAALIDPAPPILRAFGGETSATSIPIRPVAYNEADAGAPDWLNTQATRPRVYLTLGTVSFGAVEVLQRALGEISAADVEVLVTVGPEGDPSLLGELPNNVHVERFVAQSLVLPLVDVIVHHGGTGTVLSALECGLPQLILPQGADQFANADILTSIGAGRSRLSDAQQPGAIGREVTALLGDSPERHVAGRVQAEIAAMPSPAEVVPALVDLAARRVRPQP
jgi:UDP:flavonoid glycosyltransferase YjiC (YdhE family)